MCWEAKGDAALVGLIVARARERPVQAARFLASIADPDAAPALRAAITEAEPRVRSAVPLGLARSGDADDTPLLAAALHDGELAVRKAARVALAELGGPAAADELAADLARARGEEYTGVVQALAWLRDERALEPARRLAWVGLGRGEFAGREGRDGPDGVWPAVRLGDVAYRGTLIDRVVELVAELDASEHATPAAPAMRIARNAFANLASALRLEAPGELEDVEAALWERVPEHAAVVTGRRMPASELRRVAVAVEPCEPRSVARVALAELSEQPPPGAGTPPAKFGGQPDWIGEPAWPLAADGRPLVFYAQLPLLGEPVRIAYVFVSADERADTFRPLSDGNAVVIQPGGQPHLKTTPMRKGPAIFEALGSSDRLGRLSRARRYERYIRLEDGADPPTWSWPEPKEGEWHSDQPGDWNKIGGTPLFLQGEELPPGEGWRFAFQFSADRAGRELGDGAECYGFVRDDGTGAFHWQCH